MSEQPTDRGAGARHHLSPRAIGENAGGALIALGVVMLMQPLSLTLYSYSFVVTLIGTALFIVGSKLPE